MSNDPLGHSLRCKTLLMPIFFKSLRAQSVSLFFPSIPNKVLNVLSLIFFSTCMTSMLCSSFLFLQYGSLSRILSFDQFGSLIIGHFFFLFRSFPKIIFGIWSNCSFIFSTGNSNYLICFSVLPLNDQPLHQGWSIGKQARWLVHPILLSNVSEYGSSLQV